MPTTYAHDVFGRAVLQKLPEEPGRIIREHLMCYLIGLHGPDILFYYHPFHKNEVSDTGHRMHGEIASGFFARCKRKYLETGDGAVLAYTMGFICHYMLDSSCHPYIYAYTDRTGATHAEIETELDRVLMERNGKNPFHFKPAAALKGEREAVRAAASVLDGISEKQLRKCLKGMRFYTGLTVCHTPVKRLCLLKGMRIFGKRIYGEAHGRVMRRYHFKRCKESTEELLQLMKCAVPETVTVLEEFYGTLDQPEEINYRFSRNYR